MKCEICHRGPPTDMVTLHRINEKGVTGIWRCTEHLTPEQNAGIDPEVRNIVSIRADLAALRADNARLREALDGKRDGYPAWLVENGKQQGQGLKYLCMGYAGMFGWTEDPYAALHFCRRADAEAISAECEDAWRIVEHWFALKTPA